VDGTEEAPDEAYRTVRKELEAYGRHLAAKPEILALNKCDALDDETVAERRAALAKAAGVPVDAVRLLSGATRAGVQEVLGALLRQIECARAAEGEAERGQEAWTP